MKIHHSSTIDEVEHDGEKLIVTFKSGHSYAYDLGPETVLDMAESSSPGRFHHQHLKGKHGERRL